MGVLYHPHLFPPALPHLLLKMLQIGDENEADDDHKKPGSDFLGGDSVPGVNLIGIFPGAEVGGDVFSHPNEKGNEHKGNV